MGIKRLPPKSGEYLFEIVIRRYELRSTMMTSNLDLDDSNNVFTPYLRVVHFEVRKGGTLSTAE